MYEFIIAEFVQDVQIVPLDPKSEHDTAYSPSNTNGKRVKKDGRRGITRSSEGGGADGNKVMVIETKNKGMLINILTDILYNYFMCI